MSMKGQEVLGSESGVGAQRLVVMWEVVVVVVVVQGAKDLGLLGLLYFDLSFVFFSRV